MIEVTSATACSIGKGRLQPGRLTMDHTVLIVDYFNLVSKKSTSDLA